MLEAKTKGNLGEQEAKLLEHALYELRMNYVDEMNKGTPEEDTAKESEGEKTGDKEEAPHEEEDTGDASPEEEEEKGAQGDGG